MFRFLGTNGVTVASGVTTIGAGPIVTIGPTFQPGGGIVIPCTTGGTFTVVGSIARLKGGPWPEAVSTSETGDPRLYGNQLQKRPVKESIP